MASSTSSFLVLICLRVTLTLPSTKQVIDIFTNYPNTQEALKDYNKLLERRNLTPIQLTHATPEARKMADLDLLPRVITAKASNDVGFETRSRVNYNVFSYNQQPERPYNYGHTHDSHNFEDLDNHLDLSETYDMNHGGQEHQQPESDVLESEFGVFEHPQEELVDQYSQSQAGTGTVNLMNDLGTIPHHSQSLFDLSNLIEVISTRPTFLTSGKLSKVKVKRNKTMTMTPNDYLDFEVISDVPHHSDDLESDFGEIVSTTFDRHKKRKGNVKRIKRPHTIATNSEPASNNKINHNHIGHLYQQSGSTGSSKQKVTNLIRKYLIKMRNNGTDHDHRRPYNHRRNRKQSVINDRTFTNWLDDKKTQIETNVKLHEGQEKFLLGSDYSTPLESFKNKTKLFANKFLSLFTVIQFENFRCQANSAVSQYEGICYLPSECSERGGSAMGMCAEGHGVCCVFRGTCGGVGSNNCTYFESPGYPNYFPMDGGVVVPGTSTTTMSSLTPDPRLRRPGYLDYQESRQSEQANALSCIFRVYKANDNIKQMRIDFIDLELTGPTAGNCVDERLIISGTGLSMGVPPICGYNSGQHIYVDVSTLSGPLQLAVLANMIARKRYKIRICQYEDGCNGLMNCLQSYSGITGMIQSFNYDQAATFSRSSPGYFNNLNYAICIRREPGYCTVTYTNVGPNGVVYPFELRNYDDGTLTVPAGQAGAGVINCPDDYIVLDGIRLCGDRLNDGSTNDDFSMNSPVTDTSGGPIVIPVRTSASNTSRGFKLFYTQNPCSSSGGAAGTPDPRI